MAETVAHHLERMVPELEQMRRTGLFRADEISEIIKRRREFEYKTGRTMKDRQDFLRYINYEVKLLREIKLRRDKFRMSDKKSEIEYGIAKRIVKLYQIALSYFKADMRMWMSYINFCTQTKFNNVVSQAFRQMLQVHGDKKHVWLFAAKWEICESANFEGALNYLRTGLHHHPKSKELYEQAFSLELKSCEKIDKKNSEDNTKQDKAVRRAIGYFKTAVSCLGNDIEFMIKLLNVATGFEYTEVLQKEIIDYLTTNCWKSELMWHEMAQRELHGHNYNKQETHKSATQLCIAVYKSAVKVLPTTAMWEMYLDTLVEIYHDEQKNKHFKNTVLDKAFEQAYEGGYLLEKHYLLWFNILGKDEAKYTEVLNKATTALPKSAELWLIRLGHHTSLDEEPQVKIIAKQAIKALGKNSLCIYRALIKYYQLKTGMNVYSIDVKNVFEEGIARQEKEITLPLLPQYIEWISMVRSIKFSRMEYERLCNIPPYCLELHKKMIELEFARFTPSIEVVRNMYKTACSQFGKENPDVWMDMIKFEMDKGDPKAVSDIYNTALNTIDENLVSIFSTDYAILNST